MCVTQLVVSNNPIIQQYQPESGISFIFFFQNVQNKSQGLHRFLCVVMNSEKLYQGCRA